MILSVLAALSLLRNMENLNEMADKVLPAGPVGKEIEAVKELQSRVSNIMWSKQAKEPSTMLRWLRFNKMNVDKAEQGIRTHVKWRKDLDMDRLRIDPPDPALWKRFWFNVTGHTRKGDPVMVIPFGDWDLRKFADEVNDKRKFDQIQGQMWEKGLYAVEQVEMTLKKPRKDPVQYLIVCDLMTLEYRQLASYTTVQYILSMVYNFEMNYPEAVYQALMINGDWVFDALLSIMRPLMQGSIQKLKSFPKDRSKWEKVVRKHVDPIMLPYRYGGYSKAERKKLKLPPRPGDPNM